MRKFTDVMEILLDRQQDAVNELGAQAQQLLVNAMDLYTNVEARASTTINQEEAFNARILAIIE
jgi:hypothetical protein